MVRKLLLSRGGFDVRRAFHPAPDMYRMLREKGLPWLDCERGEPVSESRVVGFGVSSEILFTNVLSLIDLMGLELRSTLRDPTDPILMSGGGGISNPVPLMPFMDLLYLGEAEAGLLPVMKELCGPGSKLERLERVSNMPGVLVPELYREGRIRWMRAPALRLEDAPVKQVVPLARITHDRAVVELSRGCTRGCRFCQASQLSRPVRERSPEDVLKLLEGSIRATGWEQAGLLTLSYSDYSRLKTLLELIEPLERKHRVKVSQPSLRPDSLPGLEHRSFFRGSLTMAPEAGSERLRSMINKPLSDAVILEAARAASRMGASAIKLYFMVGLPEENDEDLLSIATLAESIAGIMGRKRKVTAALSPFVPKPHTPFQWCHQPPPDELRRRISLVRNACVRSSVSWNDPEIASVENLLSRGGPEVADILERAYRDGALFDGWSDHFRGDIWRKAFEGYSLPQFSPGEPLPWDLVDLGVSASWLREEYRRAKECIVQPDCRKAGCSGCGACEGSVPPFPEGLEVSSKAEGRRPESPGAIRFRIRYSKKGLAVFTSHLDMVRLWTRALRRTALPLVYTSGYSRRVKLAFSHPLPLGMGSSCELVDLQLTEVVSAENVAQAVREAMPGGIGIEAVAVPEGRYRSPDAMTRAAEYIIEGIKDPGPMADRLNSDENVVSCRSTGNDGLIMISDPGRGASRPDRLLEAAGANWESITRTELYTASEDGRLVPILPAEEGVFDEG